MKKIIISFLFVFIFFTACKEDNINNDRTTCGVSDPINQLEWLNLLISNKSTCELYSGATLFSYEYNKIEVIYLSNPASSLGICTQVVYNCSGEVQSSNWKTIDWTDFESKRINEKLLWKKD